jgi:hypothetical protein|tara:strand:+ start:281 stop:601 length:321 start_codon:yes stop_codon:yes gene_type:complete
MKSSLYIPLLSLLIAVQGLSAAASEKSRTWTSTDGRELEAQLVSVSETAVEVRRKDGRKFTLKLDAISATPFLPISDPFNGASSSPRKKQTPSNHRRAIVDEGFLV